MASMAGCVSRQSAAWSAVRSIALPDAAVNDTPLRSDLRYLRVTVQGKALLMVLGYVDRDENNRSVEVWYSADGEVLRTLSGRLVGLTGAPIEWSHVRLPASLPAWRDASSGQRYIRQLDEMPGYRWERVDHVTMRLVSPPGSARLEGMKLGELLWFEEVVDDQPAWATARYAITQGEKEPVYGEQCLSETLCLSWQFWPPSRATHAPATR